LEEDTCRLLHPAGSDFSLMDCNRAGVPLMELVTEPDLRTPEEAKLFAKEFFLALRYLGVSDADMEKGQLRIEANVSLSKEKGKLGTRTELKNINSFRAAERAIAFEIKRQKIILNKAGTVRQQTRGWDDRSNKTVLQREKETSRDYRYFPEPDLPPILIQKKTTEKLREEIPEMPWQKRRRFGRQYSLPEQKIDVLIADKSLADYFEKAAAEISSRPVDFLKTVKLASHYIASDLKGLLANRLEARKFLISPENFAELMAMVSQQEISSRVAKDVLAEMLQSGRPALEIVKSRGLRQVTTELSIEKIAGQIISDNPKAAADFKSGKENAIQFLLGRLMAASQGRVDPKIAAKVLRRILTTNDS
jgi:aspartyl-tRNA(Asn)/glutamyl-tRNA(Gln) amidotransferase subunit B